MFRLRPTRAQLAVTVLLGSAAGLGLQARKSSNDASAQTLNPQTFSPFTLVGTEAVSSSSSIFTFRPTSSLGLADEVKDLWHRGVWSIQIKQPQLQIARAYTPLPPLPSSIEHGVEFQDLRLLIRKEKNGEVSGYLHRLTEGNGIEVRGPNAEYVLPENVQEVIFLAGGTGIAPGLQIANALKGRATMSILWANRRREECIGGTSDGSSTEHGEGWLDGLRSLFRTSAPAQRSVGSGNEQRGAIVRQLEEIKKATDDSDSAHRLTIDYYVDEEDRFISRGSITNLMDKKSRAEPSAQQNGHRLIIVSGPDGFVRYWAGPKQWMNGREVQGPLGGILGQMRLNDWQVVKL